MAEGGNMDYPFGFEGFENREGAEDDPHPTDLELQSYCERHSCTLEEGDQTKFMKVESHLASCDHCLMALARVYPFALDDDKKP